MATYRLWRGRETVMAIAFGHVTSINRRSGRSAVAAAAYRAGCRLTDAKTGRVCDYSRKRGVVHSEVTVPPGAEWAADRQALWDAAEAAERRGDATTAREWLGALPCELTDDGRAEVAREFAGWLSERHGVAVDWSVHASDARPVTGDGEARNHHVHMLLTSRVVTPTGMGAKTRELDVKSSASGHVEAWRAEWQAIVNRQLAAASIDSAIDMRSYRRQGQSRIGLPKVGPAASAIERRGVRSDAGIRVRRVAELNRRRRAEGRRLVQEYKATQEEIMRLQDQRETATQRQRPNPWQGQRVPVAGGGGPVDDGRGRRKRREWNPEERARWRADKLSTHYDTDLQHLAEAIRQYKISEKETAIQLHDYTWIRDREKVDGKVYLCGEVTDDSINTWADICQATGWDRMHIQGDEDFKARAWLELNKRGIAVTNYEPAPHVRAALEAMTGMGGPAPAEQAADLDDEDTPHPSSVPDPEVVPSLRAPGI